jgi:endonuclease-8
MPEGHSVRRIANRFNKDFKNSPLKITSPQGRFVDSVLVSGQELIEASAIGKQMFLHFESGTIRIHLGIFGKWGFSKVEKEPVGQVRARFQSGGLIADLRGPTICELIDQAGVQEVYDRLGPDPLWPDKDLSQLTRFLERVAKSNSPIGQLLMDQSVIAGIGNVYRAELLFRAGLNPFTAGKSVPPEILVGIWNDAVVLMALGVKTGLMLTREGYLNAKVPRLDRYQVYKREGLECRVCYGPISIGLMQARKLYWCTSCQK